MTKDYDMMIENIEQDLQGFFRPVNPNPTFVKKVKNKLIRQPYTFLEPLRKRFDHSIVIVIFALVTAILIIFRTKYLKG